MSEDSLQSMFSTYVDKDSVFKNKDALTTNHRPENILHREEQIDELASILAPSLKGNDPSNVFLYGSVGTGKCVHPNTEILTSKGPKEIINIYKEAETQEKISENGETVIKPRNAPKVLTYDESMSPEVKEVKALYRQESPENLVDLETSSGREVSCTENHSFMKIDSEGSIDFYTSKSLEEGDFIAVPASNPIESTVKAYEDDFMSQISRFVGYIVGDGGINYYGDYRISITNSSAEIRDDFVQLADSLFGANANNRPKQDRTDVVEFSSKQVYSMLEDLGTEVDVLAGGKQIPSFVFGLAQPHKTQFLSALIDTDGYVSNKQSEIVYTTKSRKLAAQLSYLFLDFDVVSRISSDSIDNEQYYDVKVSGAEDLEKLLEAGLDLKISKKQKRIEKFAEKKPNTNVNLIPNIGSHLKAIREHSNVNARELEPGSPSTVHYYEEEKASISKEKLKDYIRVIEDKIDHIKALENQKTFENAKQLRKLIKYQWKDLGKKLGRKPDTVRYAVRNDSGRISEFKQEFINEVYEKAEEITRDKVLKQKIDFLNRLSKDNLVWDKIEEKTTRASEVDYVYDIEVEDNHNYVCGAGGLVSHNTLIVKHVTEQLKTVADDKDIDVDIIYINCKMKKVADTEYRLLAKLARQLGEEVPSTGLPTDEIYNRFFEALQDQKGVVVIALDEIDALVKKVGDEFLYNLTRINDDLDETKVSILGISNDLNFTDYMDSRVKSSLSEEEIIFPPYNAIELRKILKDRTDKAFVEDTLADGVISKCSALAAQEHGDARRALDLLRVAGELSERSESETVEKEHVDRAQSKIERDRVVETVRSQPKHSKLVLYTILEMTEDEDEIATGDVYSEYKELCEELEISELTQRRVSGLISELDMLGVINAKVISKGRYGRTRQISVDLSENIRGQLREMVEDKFYI